MSFFDKLKRGLSKTKDGLLKQIDGIFRSFVHVDEDMLEELEELLITADVGVGPTEKIVDALRERIKDDRISEPEAAKAALCDILRSEIGEGEPLCLDTKPAVVLVIGVNGVGKTTSIAKIAASLKSEGKKVILAAADTFRAAAIDQLGIWADRVGVDVVCHEEGSDPAAVVFDAAAAAKKRGADVLIIDTAGRLHNKKNLMEELRKMNRIIDREFPDAYRENLIVLDGTTGQNALVQAREFGEVANLTGIILTKMDGTAKGGIAVAIQSELQVPVKYIGVGETIEDLQKFDSDEFVNALFDVRNEETDDSEE